MVHALGAFFRMRHLILISLLIASMPTHASFFQTRNQNPFTLFQGQPMPLPAERVPTETSWELSSDIANSLNVDSSATQDLYVDFESVYLNLRLVQPLSHDWTLIADVPMLRRSGGRLDSLIDNWHEFFGLPRANRPAVADDQLLIRYEINGTPLIELDTPDTGLGDVSLQLGYDLLSNDATRMRLWAGLELPTGDRATLTGNDGVDANLSLAVHHANDADVSLAANIGLVLPGEDLIAQNASADSVLYFYTATSWRVIDSISLRVQLEHHQSYFEDDGLEFLGDATVIVVGGSIHFDRCRRLDIGVSEDIQVGASPDVSFLFNWTHRSCR